jgi:hypothetical protein
LEVLTEANELLVLNNEKMWSAELRRIEVELLCEKGGSTLNQGVFEVGSFKLDRQGFHTGCAPAGGDFPRDAPRSGFHRSWAVISTNATAGKAPAILPNLSGSLPNDIFTGILKL